MTSKQRSYLKSLAVNLDTIFQIGKSGVTDEICAQLLNAKPNFHLADWW